jgi:hypothetical protein
MNMARFMNKGISLEELPNTFRDTITFAYRLGSIRYVWIDSLCIRQPIKGQGYNEAEQLSDWAEQSRAMDKIYQKAYLNISATASKDGNEGLFRERKPEHVQPNVVEVRHPAYRSVHSTEDAPSDLFTCIIVSEAVYVELVDRAPVNQRGWVMQERFLAPRVLHFCEDQIAWECKECKDAEHLPGSMSIPWTELQGVLTNDHFEDPMIRQGRTLREDRLDGLVDPDSGMQDLYVYELWRNTVEAYTRTEVSFASDKLVAFSGLASHFHQRLFSPNEARTYLAGLWSTNLESQLLWYVSESYSPKAFDKSAERITGRAPSWSWAALDTPQGITYGDITDYGIVSTADLTTVRGGHVENTDPNEELLCKVLSYSISLVDAESAFGMVKGGHILLQPRTLGRIGLLKQPPERNLPYAWFMKSTSDDVEDDVEGPVRDHTDIKLDAPNSDTDIFQHTTELFLMPVAWGPRTMSRDEQQLRCLLLKFQGLYAVTQDHVNLTTESQLVYRSFTRFGTASLPYDFGAFFEKLEELRTYEIICFL